MDDFVVREKVPPSSFSSNSTSSSVYLLSKIHLAHFCVKSGRPASLNSTCCGKGQCGPMSNGWRNLPWLILSAFECLYTRFRGREGPEEPNSRSAIRPFPNPPRQLSSPIGQLHRRLPQRELNNTQNGYPARSRASSCPPPSMRTSFFPWTCLQIMA